MIVLPEARSERGSMRYTLIAGSEHAPEGFRGACFFVVRTPTNLLRAIRERLTTSRKDARRMPGHNGGFNPFRDKNGEFATQAGHGKAGRIRTKTGGGASSQAARAVRNEPPSPRTSRADLSQLFLQTGGYSGVETQVRGFPRKRK